VRLFVIFVFTGGKRAPGWFFVSGNNPEYQVLPCSKAHRIGIGSILRVDGTGGRDEKENLAFPGWVSPETVPLMFLEQLSTLHIRIISESTNLHEVQ
jgi:hypothetical protein